MKKVKPASSGKKAKKSSNTERSGAALNQEVVGALSGVIGPGPQPLQAIQQPGGFAIMTSNGHFITAVGGGGRTTDVLHTDAWQPAAWEKFRLWFVPLTGEYGLQTVNGQFLSATNGGGLASLFPLGAGEVDTILSNATSIIDYQRFRISNLQSQSALGGLYLRPASFGIQTVRGFFLTAVGGGRHIDPPVLHTDATTAKEWETFNLIKCDDPASGYTFGITEWGPNFGSGLFLVAPGGGRQPGPYAVYIGLSGLSIEVSWTLIRQSDGTYAFQTASGYYLTANGGGSVPGWRTDSPQVGNWEKFTLTPNDDCTYYIQTYNGYYVAAGVISNTDPTPVPQTVSDIKKAFKWRLFVLGLAPGTQQ